ncbi:MAG TPA: hypothetical protein VHC39_08960 [Rhizomicrobium sp.]|nr:hypothetical protein [Rhizomicrobium sp.]
MRPIAGVRWAAYVSAMTRNCAPIALFVYARLDHVQQTIDALKRNRLAAESQLIVFSDAPKRPDMATLVQSVRRYIRTIEGFKSVQIVEREINFGLSSSITSGVSSICDSYGRVIVMEDDLITSPHFLTYMNDALEKYADTPQVAAISGFHPPFETQMPETFFQCDAECWGWATWKRAWEEFNPNGTQLLAELKRRGMQRVFDQNCTYPYIRMLEDQIAGRNDSWAIRWRASVILKGMLSLYPRHTLTHNIGFDGSGTHCLSSDIWDGTLSSEPIKVGNIPLVHSNEAFQEFAQFNRRLRRKTKWDRLKRRLRIAR